MEHCVRSIVKKYAKGQTDPRCSLARDRAPRGQRQLERETSTVGGACDRLTLCRNPRVTYGDPLYGEQLHNAGQAYPTM